MRHGWVLSSALLPALAACDPGEDPALNRPRPPVPDTLPTAFADVREICSPRALPSGRRYPGYVNQANRIGIVEDLEKHNINPKLRCVVRTQAQGDAVWTRLGGRTRPLKMEEGSLWILVSEGAMTSYGRITIDSVTAGADTSVVWVRESGPGPAIGSPIEVYAAVALRIPATRTVVFEEAAPEPDEGDP